MRSSSGRERSREAGSKKRRALARYRLLGGWCREHGCLHLLTAHHRDDQIETHLIRRRAHSGPDGLAGMSAIRELGDCRLLRPLLGVARDRLLAFLEAERQPFITDPSNLDPVFERSRLRQDGGAPAQRGRCLPPARRDPRSSREMRAAHEREQNAVLARICQLASCGLRPPRSRYAPGNLTGSGGAAALRRHRSIGGAAYPPRRERIARLREVLARRAQRGHTLGGCRLSAGESASW